MKILSAIGRFFARIGRWIKETAWIQPLLIVGAIFAIIFAIPHIINGVKSWFSEGDSTIKFFNQYQLSLTGADEGDFVGNSKVDKFLTAVENGEEEDIKSIKNSHGERFFVAYVKKESNSSKDLYEGLKRFKTEWANKNNEFTGLEGKFNLITIYTDTKNDDDENLFDKVWNNHYSLFETMADSTYLPNTYYAMNKNYKTSNYESNFTSDKSVDECPMNTPLLMYFDYTEANPIATENQKVRGLSDVIFNLDGSTALDKARTLKKCWSHTEEFGELVRK